MSLNLNKHGAEIQKAWKEVCNSVNPTNWALFGYEGVSYDLKLVSKGEDGIEELLEDLNASKILYGFIRVDDPHTSLPKFVFLHWQGESVPGTRKGLAVTHLRDIQRYLHGHHVTINARHEDEVNVQDILDKVSKASASQFNFKEKPQAMNLEPPAQVGTSHHRIIPQNELPNMDERERFWSAEESKEQQRKQEELQRQQAESKRLEEECRHREEIERKQREAAIKERERKISQIRDVASADSMLAAEKERAKWEEQLVIDQEVESERRNRAEELKRKRSEEAKELVAKGWSGDARAVFERHSSAGQMNFRRSNLIAPPPPNQPSAGDKNLKEEAVNVVPPPESFGNDVVAADPDVTNASSKPDLIQDVEEAKSVPDVTRQDTKSSSENGNGHLEYGTCAMALYDYQAADETEISFDPGQIITHIDKVDPGWWHGLGPDGSYGLFPANHVDLLEFKDNQIVR